MIYDVVIWTPINKTDGFGHFYRMMGLYELLKDNNVGVTYFTNSDYIKLETVKIIQCKKEKIEEIAIFFKEKMVKVLIIDNYDISMKEIEYLSKYFKIVFFDAKFENPSVDILMNFNPYALLEYSYKHKNTRYFLGLEYMSFRKDLRGIQNDLIDNNTVFISIGGTDITHTTYELLTYLPNNFTYHIILGKGCEESYCEKVLHYLNTNNFKFHLYQQPKNYFDIMSKCEFAICTCSTTVYELIYLSKPFVCINVTSNQNMITSYLSKEGIITLNRDTLHEIASCIERKLFKKLIVKTSNNVSLIKSIEDLVC